MIKKLTLYAALMLFCGTVVAIHAHQVELCSNGDCDSCSGNNRR